MMYIYIYTCAYVVCTVFSLYFFPSTSAAARGGNNGRREQMARVLYICIRMFPSLSDDIRARIVHEGGIARRVRITPKGNIRSFPVRTRLYARTISRAEKENELVFSAVSPCSASPLTYTYTRLQSTCDLMDVHRV